MDLVVTLPYHLNHVLRRDLGLLILIRAVDSDLEGSVTHESIVWAVILGAVDC